jgi:hypothetical protein
MVYSDYPVQLCLMATVLRCTCLFWEPSASLDISQRFLTFGIKQRYQKGSKHLSGLLRLEGAQQGRQSRAQGTSRTLQQCLTISESLCSRAGTVAKHQRCQTTHGIGTYQYTVYFLSTGELCRHESSLDIFKGLSEVFATEVQQSASQLETGIPCHRGTHSEGLCVELVCKHFRSKPQLP